MIDGTPRQPESIDTLMPAHEQQSETVVVRVMEQFSRNQTYTEIAAALAPEELAQFAKHTLTNFYTIDDTERRAGMEVIAHGDISEEDLPLVAALVREMSVDYSNNPDIRRVSTAERLKAFKCLQVFLNRDILSEEIRAETASVLIEATQGFLNVGDEGTAYNTVCVAHSFAEKVSDSKITESLRNVCKNLDESIEPNAQNLIPQFLGGFETEYLPKTSQKTATMIEENIAESPALARALIQALDDIRNHPDIEKLLTSAVKTSHQAAKSFLQTGSDYSDEEWYGNVKVAALVALDTFNDIEIEFDEPDEQSLERGRYSTYFRNIPIEALEFQPDYVFTEMETQDETKVERSNDFDKTFSFASNGFIALKTLPNHHMPQLGNGDINQVELHHIEQILAPALVEQEDKLRYKGCIVHFIPGDNVQGDRYAPLRDVQEYLRMGVAGITNFLKFCDENEISDQMVLAGVTNPRMANLLVRLGFHTPDFKPEVLKQIVKHKEDLRNSSGVQVITNVGELREMTNNRIFKSFQTQLQ